MFASCERAPEALAFTFLSDGEGSSETLRYGDLSRRVLALAATLQERRPAVGERALLLYPPGLDFVVAFLGCLASGVIAVPAYPVFSERGLARLLAIVGDCAPRLVLTTGEIAPRLRQALARIPGLPRLELLATESLGEERSADWQPFEPSPETLAFLQYTSGSTAAPKGVEVSHGNLLHNEGMIQTAFGLDASSVVVSWLPLYHDMGLIGGVLQPLHLGAHCVLMSPHAFLKRPVRWLEAITRYRGTTSGGPDFAYSLAARKVSPEDRSRLDLSSWRLAFNGAEPVRAATLERFAATFADCGFDRRAFYPCYGLAEATLFVAGGQPGAGATTLEVDPAALEAGRAVPAPATVTTAPAARALVGCGGAWLGQELRIVDRELRTPCSDGEVGEIWLRGPSVARGYWGRPEASAETFGARLADGSGPYLRTGDLGFALGGQLFVTGRLKDLIIVRGRNLYPQDLELAAERAHPALRPGCGAAFGLERGSEEQVVLVQEVDRRASQDADALEAMREAIRRAVVEEHDVALAEVVLIREQTLPKTSSGKVQRHGARAAFEAGTLARLGPDPSPSPEPAAAGTEPVSELAALLAEELAKALPGGARRLPLDRPLTALGLDSLAAAEVAEALAARLGVTVGLPELLAGPTVLELAALVFERLALARMGSVTETLSPRAPAPAEGEPFPVTVGQAALWFLDRLEPGNPAYVIARALELHGALDPERLARAFEALLERHAALRCRFGEGPDGPSAHVAASPPRAHWWHLEDASTLAASALAERVDTLALEPFDLANGPLLRVHLLAIAPTRHLLLVAVHHVAADFRSLARLFGELEALYRDGSAAVLPAAGVHPAQVAAWQRQRLEPARGELERWWRDALSPLPSLELPTDHPRPAAASFQGGIARACLPRPTLEALTALASEAGATLFATIASLFAAVLERWAGGREIVLGTPTRLARPASFGEGVGYLVNPVPLRLEVGDEAGLAARARQAAGVVARALEHAELPFAQLVEALAPERDPSRSPIFQAMVVLQQGRTAAEAEVAGFAVEHPGASARLGDLEARPFPLGRRGAQLDLTLIAAPLPTGLGLALEYATDLFEPATAERLLAAFVHLTSAALAAPEAPLVQLPLDLPLELGLAAAPTKLPASSAAEPAATLAELFAEQARATPALPALHVGGSTLAYAELDARVGRLAALLAARGVGPEIAVAVCLERTAELVVALLAVHRAGGLYVPLDPTYPEERLAFMLEDSGAQLLLTQPSLVERLPASLPPLLFLDGRELAPPRSPMALREALPANLAYLIYTSGSTGKPKAVAITHASAVARVRWGQRQYSAAERAAVLAATSVCFDLSIFELFVPLASGGSVVLVANALELPSLGRLPVTLVNTVPSAAAELVRLGGIPATVRTVNLAGEPLPRSLADALYRRPHIERVHDLYGPSEDTTYSTGSLVPRDPARRVTIGRPLPGTRATIEDRRGRRVPVGVPGELLLAGVGLARGYLGRPALTAERFVPDPDAPADEPGARRYRTGDLVRQLANGELDFLGRLDHQVKVRGFRIELGEIEAALRALPGVEQTVVVARRDTAGDAELVAYVAGAATPSAEALADRLRAQLPPYLVPARFERLAELPLTANGKIDRARLPQPGAARGDASEPPRGALEAALADLFAEVLGVPGVGRHDGFFHLGGHSLKAASFVSRLRERLGHELPVRTLFQAPTVAELARLLGGPPADPGPSDEPPTPNPAPQPPAPPPAPAALLEPPVARALAGNEIAVARLFEAVLEVERVGPTDDFFALGGHSLKAARLAARLRQELLIDLPVRAVLEEPTVAGLAALLARLPRLDPEALAAPPVPTGAELPLAFSQERLWFLDQLEPGSPFYNLSGGLALEGSLDVGALAASLGAVVARHQALRTAFYTRDGAPIAVLQPPGPPPLALVDLGALAPPVRDATAALLLAAEARRPFALERPPFVRTVLLRLAPTRHQLGVSFHHVASDGWSLGVFVRELVALYPARLKGTADPLPALPMQFADFALWQRGWLAGERSRLGLEAWRQRLAGAPARLDLPSDRPRGRSQSHRGGERTFALPASTTAALEHFAAHERGTPFMVWLAAYAAWLGRLSGQAEVVVGTAVANRSHPLAEELIGFFVNTLALRTAFPDDPTFHTLVARARETVLDAYAHEDVPFDLVVEAVAPERSLAHAPLFQVLLVLQNTPEAELALPGLTLEPLAVSSGTAKFDLTLTLERRAEGFVGSLSYAADLFDATTAERFARQLGRLLEDGLARPEARLSELALLLPAERHQVLWESQDTAREHPEGSWLALLEPALACYPERIAVVAEGEHLSFAGLDAAAERLARQLEAVGVAPEERVALELGRTPAMLAGLLGVARAGGAFVPLDPSAPAERRRFVLADAAVRTVIESPDGWLAPDLAAEGRPLDHARSADSLAYVLYTSGSTGQPKGVAIRDGALGNLQAALEDTVYAGARVERVGLTAPFFFDASVKQWLQLAAGRTLIVVPDAARRNGEELLALIERERFDALDGTPAQAQMLLAAGLEAALGAGRLALCRLLLGGEAIDAARWQALAGLPQLQCWNVYGPTEATVDTTAQRITAPLIAGGSRPALGRPLANVTARVLDRHGRPQPLGALGELWIGGRGVARGYLGRPAQTAERFRPDPWSRQPGARAYGSGDRVRQHVDGTLEYLGRLDRQVKLLGFRLELGEVEAHLAAHPAVAAVAVQLLLPPPLSTAGPEATPELVAWVVPQPERTLPAGELTDFLRARLPGYLVPSRWVELERLPLSANGKVDLAALPRPAEIAPAAGAEPLSPIEEMVAGIWTEVLGRAVGGRHDDFFDLGGHSLAATQVASRLRSAFGIELPLARLFEQPSLGGLADEVAAALGTSAHGGPERSEPIPRQPEEAPLELSFAQERLWFLAQLEPASVAYNVPALLRLRGALVPTALAAALAAVVARHETLRLRIVEEAGEPKAEIIPAAPASLSGVANPVVDLGALADAEAAAVEAALAARVARQPFDLARGPLLRTLLLRRGADEHALALCCHHLASDGWSVGVLLRELAAVYRAHLGGAASAEAADTGLAPLAVRYRDYAAWQRRTAETPALRAQLEAWRAELTGLPVLELPTDRPRRSERASAGELVPFRLLTGRRAELETFARRQGATVFLVLASAFTALLARYTGQRDLAFGTPVANRTRQEIEGLIGFFVNTLVLRTQLLGDPSFASLLGQLRRTALAAYGRQEVPFERVVQAVAGERDRASQPLFQVLFALETELGALPTFPALALELEPLTTGAAKFELACVVGAQGDGFRGQLELAAELFERSTGERFAAHLANLLGAALTAPETPLARLPLLDEAERRELHAWAAGPPLPPARAVDALIGATAERVPERVALVEPAMDTKSGLDAHWSYAGLLEQAHELAAALAGCGVGAGDRVAFFLERTAAVVLVPLACWRLGAAFVPLDPAYPAERLRLLLEDSLPRLVLTEAALAARLPAPPAGTRVLGFEEVASTGVATGEPTTEAPDAVAYVMYTSGSTGRPKGVTVTHRGIARLALATGFEADPGTFYQLAPVAFDAATFEIWTCLVLGGRLVLGPRGPLDLDAIAGALPRHAVRNLFLTAGLFHQLVEDRPEALAGVDVVLTGGDVVSASHVERALPAVGGGAVVNAYGPTENACMTTLRRFRTGEGLPARLPIGRPLAATEVWVLDARLELAARGVPGELATGGAGLAQGYLGRPGATAERFRPDGWSGRPGSRVYLTGDRVRLRPDGDLDFLGRFDAQIKVRGHRIEPAEVEAALLTGPELAAAAVLAQDGPGGKVLVAYVVPRAGETPLDVEALRRRLAATLPAPMVPAAFVELAALPQTEHGKLDRRRLPAPRLEALAAPGRAPAPGLEATIADLFAEVLGTPAPAADDDFFALGGHSLLATRFVGRLRRILGRELPLTALFSHPSPAALARWLAANTQTDAARLTAAPTAAEAPGAEPAVSFAQERLWFLDQLEPGGTAYNIPLALALEGTLPVETLASALAALVDRHEVLRTLLVAVDGRPRARIMAPPTPRWLPVLDLTALAAPAGVASGLADTEAGRPFDLARGPLLRATLLRLGPQHHHLLLDLHHIVADGASLALLVAELEAGWKAGETATLPALPLQYRHFAAWQRQRLAGAELETELDYWRGQLAGLPALELPTDRPRPALRSASGARSAVALPAALTGRLAARAATHGGTLFMAVAAGFAALLARLAGQPELALGTPVANRTRPELEGLIGLFVNTLTLRFDLRAAPSFDDLLTRTVATALAAYEHQEVPFEMVVEAVAPERSLATTPLFQVLLVLQNQGLPKLRLPGLSARPLERDATSAKFDLTLAFAETADGLVGSFEYAADLFDPTTIERWAGHLERLLTAALARPERPVATLPWLSPGEELQLATWGTGATPAPPPAATVDGLVLAAAAARPEAVAVVFEDEHLSYGELERRARQLGAELARRGIGPEVVVGVLAERSLSLPVALLGVLAAGGAYLPLDPDYPAERLRYLVADAGARLVLWHGAAPVELGVPTLELGAVLAQASAAPFPSPPAEPDRAVYVIHTSGSTGEPKGVVNAHRGVVNRLVWQGRLFGDGRPQGLAQTERVVQKTPITFDVSAWELFWTLGHGGTLVMARPEGHRDPAYLVELVARERVTTIHFVASLLEAWLHEPGLGELDSLRRVVTSGEALVPTVAERCHACLPPHVELWDFYGPTEAAIEVTAWRCERVPGLPTIPIGRPIDGARVLVLDAHGGRQPVGVPGELALGGLPVARGYLGRPAATARSFVPDAYGGQLGARLYRSGDRARFRPDGVVEYLGRLDHQVKVRGFRVELGEIEDALRRHPSVAEAAVALANQGRLVAHVVPHAAADWDPEGLASWLADRLPAHFLPQGWNRLDALPLTASGKLDRKRLPEPRWGDEAATGRSLEGALEHTVAAIWSEVLGIEVATADASFWRAGGHSLLATQVVSRLRDRLGLEVPVRSLFEAPDLAGFAERLGRLQAVGPDEPALVPLPANEDPPLSWAQERIWVLDRFEPGSAAYNMPGGLLLRGRLVPAALAAALATVLERHAVLRTALPSIDGRPLQRLVPTGPRALPVVDLSALAESRGALERLARREAAVSFDLAQAPLLRARLVRLADDEHALLYTLHHVAGDGWSLGVLAREIPVAYADALAGRASSLAPLAVQYGDFAAWQRRWLRGHRLERQLAYWRTRLGEAPPALALPTDFARAPVRRFVGGRVASRLAPALLARLEALAADEGATLFMVLLAAFKALLARLSGELDVAVGTPVAGRERSELEPLVGIFLNTLVLRTDLGSRPSWRTLLRRVRETALGAFAHQEVPFELLLDELQPVRDLARSPFFEVFFNLLSFPLALPRLPELEVEPLSSFEATSKFDLTLYASPQTEGLLLTLVFNADLFAPARAEEMLAQLELLLEACAGSPDAPFDACPLVTARAVAVLPDPTAELSERWRGAVHELFAAQAAAQPDRPALHFATSASRDAGPSAGSWTYSELEARSNRLAHRLLAGGLARGGVVAIWAQRNPSLVWALLGTLKAGGAFAILDPAHPPARLAAMVERVRPQVVLELAAAGPLPESVAAALTPSVLRLRLPDATLDDADPWQDQPETPPAVALGPDDTAYLAFTSGSTGEPKAIVGRHGPLAHFWPWYRERFGLGPEDRTSLLAGLSHDPLHRDLFLALTQGGAVAIPEPGHFLSAGWLAGWLAASRVTVANLTPALGELLATDSPEGQLPELRLVLFVGDALAARTAERLARLAPRARIVNLYGATESQQALSWHEVPATAAEAGPQPLGRGLPDVQLLLLGAGGGLAGVGELGEIWIRSPHLARGYLDDPAATAARFHESASGEHRPTDRRYATGDLGRYDLEGNVRFVGRADHQVKVRGFRVELGEIEHQLRRVPTVLAAAVLARETPQGRTLVAYMVPRDPELPPEPAALRQHLGRELPAYMVPAGFVLVDELPLNPNGKLDRKALARRAPPNAEERMAIQAPQTELERTIARELEGLLGLNEVGLDASFFELGGNSLLLVQFQSRLQQVLEREVPTVALFNHPTVRSLAAHLASHGSSQHGPAGPASTTTPDRGQELAAGRDRLRRRFAQRHDPPRRSNEGTTEIPPQGSQS